MAHHVRPGGGEVDFSVLDSGVLVITLQRPEKRNALTMAMLSEIAVRISEDAASGVVITGTAGIFSSGVDLREAGEIVERFGAGYLIDQVRSHLRSVTTAPLPVVAAVNGAALAGGLELALACDWIVVSDQASVSDHHASVGLVPGAGALGLMAWRTGWSQAQRLVLTAQRLSAAQAFDVGLVDEVVAAENVVAAAVLAVERLRGQGAAPQFVKRVKAASVWDGELAMAERSAAEEALEATLRRPPAGAG